MQLHLLQSKRKDDMADVVNIEDFRKKKEFDVEIDLDMIDQEKLMKLYNDVMQSDSIHDTIENATIDFARSVISQLYELDIDPEDEIAEDMVFLTMLFTAVLDEFYTGRYESSGGTENTIYRHVVEMQKANK